jgi:hypothetical protein
MTMRKRPLSNPENLEEIEGWSEGIGGVMSGSFSPALTLAAIDTESAKKANDDFRQSVSDALSTMSFPKGLVCGRKTSTYHPFPALEDEIPDLFHDSSLQSQMVHEE